MTTGTEERGKGNSKGKGAHPSQRARRMGHP